MTGHEETGLLGLAGQTGCRPFPLAQVSDGRAANQKRGAFR